MAVNKKRLTIVLVVIAAGLGYLVWVRLTDLAIPCLLNTLSGGHLKCPGCGVSHMCLYLSRFEFGEAFLAHPIIFCLIPFWCTSLVLWILDRAVLFRKIVVWGSVITLVGYGILRNFLGF
jgi:hypothetical protein